MKSFLLAASALVLSAGLASAADLAPKPYVKAPILPAVYDWSGWYVGGNGGWGQSSEKWTGLDNSHGGSYDANGGTAGGQFGWRTQAGQLVYGLDFQANWADFSGQTCGRFACLHNNVQNYETLAVTGGWAFNNVLLYAKGGAAAVQSHFAVIHSPSPLDNNDAHASRWGGLLGAGLEYGLTPNWTIGVEYNHIFGGDQVETTNYVNFPGSTSTYNIRQDLDIVTARVNYKFGGPVIARY